MGTRRFVMEIVGLKNRFDYAESKLSDYGNVLLLDVTS